MPLEIALTRDAAKELARLPATDRERVERRIEAYAEAPGHDVIALAGARGLYRLRSGDRRVIFELEEERMRILSVKHRREAHR